MRNKKIIISAILVLIAVSVLIGLIVKRNLPKVEFTKEIKPFIGSIENIISTTGIVLPKNRLEIKPPVNGRIETILVVEGQKVKAGETLALMSSTERAALLDAARGQGKESLDYWKEVYRPISLMSPINAEVIVAKTQPGQTVTTNDAVIVLSDQLIVRAQVDETDIGKVRAGQEAEVSLDAYPEKKIKAKVEHIYYESKTVNNVTIYEVDLIAGDFPEFLRSGMNTAINFMAEKKDNALLAPNEALIKEKDGDFVLLKGQKNGEAIKRQVEIGISDEKNTEILSGITVDDVIIIKSKKYALPKGSAGTNPFIPFRGPRR